MAETHEIVELGNGDCNCSASPSSSSSSSSSVYHSTRIEALLRSKSDYETALDYEIAASKDHWSELQQPSSVVEDSSGGEEEKARMTNSEIILSLQRQFPHTGDFFRHTDFVLGKKIAEGAQAEIFEAKVKDSLRTFALKVFKEGSSVLDLQKQWPLGMLNNCPGMYITSPAGCSILCGTVVMNGRFAFQMFRCAGDLRKLIDKRMERNNKLFCGPFPDGKFKNHMYMIALGMMNLHKDNIVHRDLKASNVLISDGGEVCPLEDMDSGSFYCLVADYECSVGVVGTAFWRAPEILEGVKARKITPDLFTKEADVYSYAMTCYELITGRIPFEGVKKNNYDVVLRGDRPVLPEHIEPGIKTLLSRCWHSNPKERPSFEEIIQCI